jgi:hypothetical protein
VFPYLEHANEHQRPWEVNHNLLPTGHRSFDLGIDEDSGNSPQKHASDYIRDFDWISNCKRPSALDVPDVQGQKRGLLLPRFEDLSDKYVANSMAPIADPAKLHMVNQQEQEHESFWRQVPRDKPQMTTQEARRTLPESSEFWSQGSENHPGGCTPCALHCFRRTGCAAGERCGFCHMEHVSGEQGRREGWKRYQQERRRRMRSGAGAADVSDTAWAARALDHQHLLRAPCQQGEGVLELKANLPLVTLQMVQRMSNPDDKPAGIWMTSPP